MPRVQISELHIRILGTSEGLATAVRGANRTVEGLGRRRRDLNGLTGSLREFEQILARTLALYGAFAAGRFVTNQVFDGVKLAADAELAAISLEVLLGSAEDATRTLNQLYDFVETTPFRLNDVRDSTQLLAAFGVEAELLLPTLRSLGDISAGINQPVRELADLYGRTLNEQRLYTRDLNQFTSRGIPLIQELASTFGVAEDEVRGLAESGLLMADDVTDAFARMTSEGGRYFQLTQRQSKTTAGEFSNFLDEVDRLKREFGSGLLPVLREFLGVLREMIVDSTKGGNVLSNLRRSGEEAGKWLRFFAATARGTQLVLVGLVRTVNSLFVTLDGATRLIRGLEFNGGFFETFDKELVQQQARIRQSIIRLRDYDRALIETGQDNGKFGKTLADAIDLVPLAVRRAQNDLKQLTESATSDAEKLAEQFRTPFERFVDASERIAKGQVFGGLQGDVATRAINAEIEKLVKAKEALEAVQETGALVRGTRQEFEARNQRFQRPGGADGETAFNTDALARVFLRTRNRIRTERTDLAQRAEGVRDQQLNANLQRQINEQRQAARTRELQLRTLINTVNLLLDREVIEFEQVSA
ncbi:MAG: tape measure protein [Planctomycetota bacterium]